MIQTLLVDKNLTELSIHENSVGDTVIVIGDRLKGEEGEWEVYILNEIEDVNYIIGMMEALRHKLSRS